MIPTARAAIGVALRTSPRLIALYLVVMVGEAVAPIATAWLTKLLIDGLSEQRPIVELIPLAAGLAATGIAVGGLPHCSKYLGNEIGRSFAVRTTHELFTATLRFVGLRRFEDPDFHDRLRLAQSSLSLGQGIVTGGFGAARSVITLVGMVGSLAVVSPALTGIVLAVGVPALVAQLRLSHRRASMTLQVSPTERRQHFYSTLLGTVEAAKEIRLFESGPYLRARMMDELRTANTARRRMDLRELSVEGALALLSTATAGGGLVWAVTAAASGALTVGDVSLLIAGVAAVQSALNGLISGIAGLHQDLLIFGHYVAVTETGSDLPAPAQAKRVPPLRYGIRLNDVWFRYSEDHPWILRGLNLLIPANASVGVVGLNGAGKSTIVKLLCRFYDPDHGSITWDGVDIRDFYPDELRRRVTGVFQDHMAYDMSATDNVSIGLTHARDDPDRVRAAAAEAGIHDTFADLPRGYETMLTRVFFGEDDRQDPTTGVVLSGGQWQRTALARAFFRHKRDLMVLDEPSSGLDPEAEADLHARTRRNRLGQATLLISHRLNTVRDADIILVVDGGVVTETGSHDHLMSLNGDYARLFQLQASGYQQQVTTR